MEEKQELYHLLDQERFLLIDPNTGDVVRRESWVRVNLLLDCLVELNAVV